MADSGIAATYRKIRGSAAFLWILLIFCATWVTLYFLLAHFDPGLGGYNSILSTEASIGNSLLMMWMQKQDETQRKQLEYLQALMEAQRDTLKELIVYEKARMAECPGGDAGGGAVAPANVA